MQTLLLDRTNWDLVLDVGYNIAVASDPYSLAQDAASAIKTFAAEVYYDTTQGVPYFAQILGHAPPVALMKAKFEAAAKTVPDVASAKCFIASIQDRQVNGQVQVTDGSGQISAASF